MPYPSLGLSEDYIETPSTTKHGFIVPVTREAIFFDRTHLVLQRASEVGEVLGLNKEKRLIDLVIGAVNNYKWKGTPYNTCYGGADNGPWVNAIDEELVDWTDVDAAEQVFADILDPNTGEPVLVQPTTVLVMPAYRHTANRVLKATEIIFSSTDNADSHTLTTAANPFGPTRSWKAGWPIGASWPPGRTSGRQAVVVPGDFRRPSPTWRTGPLPSRRPANSEAEFNQDIVLRFKASERGAAAVINPRYVVKSSGANQGSGQ